VAAAQALLQLPAQPRRRPHGADPAAEFILDLL